MGLYMPKLPKFHKIDFRAEIVGTPTPTNFPGFVYWDFRRFRDGYTNDRNLLASWMGAPAAAVKGGSPTGFRRDRLCKLGIVIRKWIEISWKAGT